MQKSIWKLTALAGVVGVGFLGVMQAQRGLTDKEKEGRQSAAFADFDAPGDLEGDAPEFGAAGSEPDSNDEIDFGQSEPSPSTPELEAVSGEPNLGKEFPVAQASGTGEAPDPFDKDSDEANDGEPQFERVKPRRTRVAELDTQPSGGLDFRSEPAMFPEPEPGADDEPQSTADASTARQDDNPFAFTDDEFQPKKADDPAPDPAGGDSTDSFAADDSREMPAPGVARIADNPDVAADDERSDVRQASQFELEPDAEPAPSGDDGPRLFAPAAEARPMAEPKPSEPEPESDDRAAGPFDDEGPIEPVAEKTSPEEPLKPPQVADDPFADESESEDSPENPEPRPLPSLEGPKRSAAGERPPVPLTPQAAPDSPQPDPGAFDDLGPAEEQPVPQRRTAPPEMDASDSLPFRPEVDESDDEPQPSLEPHRDSEPAVGLKSADAPEIDSAPPERLAPLPDAARSLSPTENDLAGDATVGADAPRGPQRPQLSIVKQAPPNAVLGEPMIYSIIVKNVGDSPASRVTVEDRIPKGTRLTGTIPRAEMFQKKLTWKLGTLGPNQQRRIQVRVIPFEPGQIGSVATVNFVAQVAARTMITSPSLKLDLSVPPQADVGGKVTLRFKVTNDGSAHANGVVLRNLLPAQLSHPSGKDLEFTVGQLPPGQSKNVNLVLTAAKPGLAVSKAVVTADGNLTAEAAAKVEVVGSLLHLTRRGPRKRYLGRPVTYVNRVTNKGDEPIGPVTITETIPAGLEFVKATHGGQFNESNRTIAWRIDQLGAGESKDVTVVLTATSAGAQGSTVTVSGPEGKGIRVRSNTEILGLAALSANLSGITGPVLVGETVALKVRVANRGNSRASGVKVRMTLPAHLSFVTSEGPVEASARGNEVVFQALPAIEPQTEKSVTIVLKAARPGEARLKVHVDSDQLSRPLSRDDALVIYGDGP